MARRRDNKKQKAKNPSQVSSQETRRISDEAASWQKKQRNDRPEERQTTIKRRGLFDYVTLAIALLGACTGVYSAYKEWLKPSQIGLQINYNKDISAFLILNSDNPNINGRVAIFVHSLILAGYGQNPFYPRQINMSVRCKGSLKTVSRIIPTKHKAKDTDRQYVAVYRIGSLKHIAILDWEDFKPNRKGLSIGEPYAFSYVGHFDLNKDDLHYCDRISITVQDYLDNIFEKFIDASLLPINKDYLMCMKQLEQCEADAKRDYERLKDK